MIRVALPSKGRLQQPALDLLASCGYSVRAGERRLTHYYGANEVQFFFLRPDDIPVYVATGTFDAGITGQDMVAERGQDLRCAVELNFGRSRLCAAVPVGSGVADVREISSPRIATSFPALTRAWFGEAEVHIVELAGAVEVAVGLGIADAVVDVVETGSTLKEAGLEVVGPPLFESTAALFLPPGGAGGPQVAALERRLAGRMLADTYMMVEYDAPAALLDAACAITPGLQSPTIAPLRDTDWFAVRAMVRRHEAHRILDELAELGCQGIVLTRIEHARP
jgi:ATP phosphoribosyltransferase